MKLNWTWVSAQDDYQVPALSELIAAWKPVEPTADTEIPAKAEVFVREIVQNFLDASQDWQTGHALGVPELDFEFLSFSGQEAQDLRERLDLGAMSDTYNSLGEEVKKDTKLNSDSQVFGAPTSELTFLVVRETNTSGMYGPWKPTGRELLESGLKQQNKMLGAFLKHSRSFATAGKGLGSYGEGKKAIINISSSKSVLAYTAYDPQLAEDGSWSRFLGFTYWQDFARDGNLYSGLSMLGKPPIQGTFKPQPFENEEATAAVNHLAIPGLNVRHQGETSDWGTTLVFIDPTITPEECAESLVRNWWPLLDTEKLIFRVTHNGNHIALPNPESISIFRELAKSEKSEPFVTDWEQAAGPAIEVAEIEVATVPGASSGRLVLAIDNRPSLGFSSKDEESNRSLVALIRDGMVIHYYSVKDGNKKDKPPFARAVFWVDKETHPESERMLRHSEPPLHNEWRTRLDEQKSAANHARAVMSQIRSLVTEMKDKYKSSVPQSELDLATFREAFSLKSKAGPRPIIERKPRSLFSVTTIALELQESQNHQRLATTKQSVKLSEIGKKLAGAARSLDVTIRLGWSVQEEGSFAELGVAEQGHLKIPAGFTLLDGTNSTYSGKLSSADMRFEWASPEYAGAWTIKPILEIVHDNPSEELAEVKG